MVPCTSGRGEDRENQQLGSGHWRNGDNTNHACCYCCPWRVRGVAADIILGKKALISGMATPSDSATVMGTL